MKLAKAWEPDAQQVQELKAKASMRRFFRWCKRHGIKPRDD